MVFLVTLKNYEDTMDTEGAKSTDNTKYMYQFFGHLRAANCIHSWDMVEF